MAERAIDRVRHSSLAVHATALLVCLLGLVPVVGVAASYSADEGAAIIQAQSLAEGDGWIIPHPLPELDPAGELYPLELAPSGPDGTAAYARHPLYPLILSGAEHVGGHAAMVVLSLIGTWAAALGAAALARAIYGGYARSSLWLAGLGSPLLFHAYWVTAHSLAAAAIAWATVLLVRSERVDAPRWGLFVAAPLAALATLLRTEAVIFAIALSAGVAGAGVLRRRAHLVAGGGAIIALAGSAYLLDRRWMRWIVGGEMSGGGPFEPRSRSGGLENRIDAFVATWLRPVPPGEDALAGAAVLAAIVLIGAGVFSLRRAGGRGASLLLAAGATLLVVRVAALSAASVPGLVMAFPLLLVAVIGLRVTIDLARWEVRLVVAVVGLGWLGVLATQYAEGGVAEWGGRYFILGIPLVIPIVVAVADRVRQESVGAARQALPAALIVSMAALSCLTVRELRSVHTHTDRLLTSVATLAAEAGSEPVIVTDASPLPRLDWKRFEQHRWLLLDPAEHPDLPERLDRAGHERWVLVARDADAALRSFSRLRVVDRVSSNVLLVELDGQL